MPASGIKQRHDFDLTSSFRYQFVALPEAFFYGGDWELRKKQALLKQNHDYHARERHLGILDQV